MRQTKDSTPEENDDSKECDMDRIMMIEEDNKDTKTDKLETTEQVTENYVENEGNTNDETEKRQYGKIDEKAIEEVMKEFDMKSSEIGKLEK